MPVKVRSDRTIRVYEGGQQTTKNLARNVCFAITTKRGERIVVAPVVTTNRRGVEVVRFRKVVDASECPATHEINRKVPKLKIGYREMPKALGLMVGAKKAAPAKVMGKLLIGATKKKGAKTTTTK